MNKKQKIAIFALPVLVIFMYAIFQLATKIFGRELAWHIGFFIYWPIWCLSFPLWMVGRKKFRELFRYNKLNKQSLFLLISPFIMALIGRFIMEYYQVNIWARLVLVLYAFANGSLEEILWRGVYIKLFPDKKLWGILWPTLWFSIWHYAPGSVSTSFNPFILMAGAAVFGLCWSWLAMKTKTIRWSVISHISTALVRVVG
ncbi:MAG: CPBP family intramembrane metalloprotease [Candidatus Aminicenantes bacterium]|nr:CPBP family intramembrane metalloprotease [Candidatus Aminicenantes bacterium]